MKKHAKPVHGSHQWLELRHRIDNKCVIGASEVPALMGVSPYKTRNDLFIDKMTPVEVNTPTAAMRRGTLLEPALIEFAREELDRDIIVPEVMYQNDRIIATLDGQVDDLWGVEAKTTNIWTEGSPLPIEFTIQAQAQMFAAEMERVTFTILDRNMRLSLIDVIRDESFIDIMREQSEQFASRVDDGSGVIEDFTLPQVAALYPEPSGEAELDSRTIDMLIEWNALKEQGKHIEEREKAIKDEIANMLRDAEYGVVNGERVVSFKRQTQNRIDSAKLKKILDPQTLTEVTTTSSFRVMRGLI
jgi:putative phage-type endonuclease